MITIDPYGFLNTSVDYFRRVKRAVEIKDDAVDTTKTYIRYTTNENCPIWRIDGTDGTIYWAVGAWTDRETLTYETDTNTPLVIADSDID